MMEEAGKYFKSRRNVAEREMKCLQEVDYFDFLPSYPVSRLHIVINYHLPFEATNAIRSLFVDCLLVVM